LLDPTEFVVGGLPTGGSQWV